MCIHPQGVRRWVPGGCATTLPQQQICKWDGLYFSREGVSMRKVMRLTRGGFASASSHTANSPWASNHGSLPCFATRRTRFLYYRQPSSKCSNAWLMIRDIYLISRFVAKPTNPVSPKARQQAIHKAIPWRFPCLLACINLHNSILVRIIGKQAGY
jgi:hypothetical protein